MYAGFTPLGPFAETLLPAPGVLAAITASAAGATIPISGRMLASRGLAKGAPSVPLQCVDLRGPGLARIGADGRLTTGARAVAQRWSLALWAHPKAPDGIMYRTRRDPSETAIAIFDRAKPKIAMAPLGGLKEPRHAGLLAQILQRYAIAEIP